MKQILFQNQIEVWSWQSQSAQCFLLQPRGAVKPQYPSGHSQSSRILKVPENRREEGKRRVGRKQTVLQPSKHHCEKSVTYDNTNKKYCCMWVSMHTAYPQHCSSLITKLQQIGHLVSLWVFYTAALVLVDTSRYTWPSKHFWRKKRKRTISVKRKLERILFPFKYLWLKWLNFN